ncbi:MAG TPA: methyltransferase domain-containing protein [Chthoniobacterales bacterium]|jgi:SAM-dependent methyltransferase|nr:methyltransferase domain-containing protein [Chthoniobacterales bacterium]
MKNPLHKLRRKGAPEETPWEEIAKKVRAFAAYRFIKGSGIEIGALHQPLHVYHRARVRYLDRLPTNEARKLHPELAGETFVPVDLIDDSETLGTILDASCDFVIASHVLEHCRNPIGALENMLRVLKPGGTVFLAVPDKRQTFDASRPVTSYEHIARDYRDGPESSDLQHFEEKTTRRPDQSETAAAEARHFFAQRTNVHFHVWTTREIIELLQNVQRDFGFPFELEMIARNGAELVIVLRKSGNCAGAETRA